MFEQVKEFHEKFGVPICEVFNDKNLNLRFDLMDEELTEVYQELFPISGTIDKIKLTKELSDLLYVTLGTAVQYGLPIEKVFNAVHQSNMSKLGEDGKPLRREDGKVLKGPNYKEPDLKEFF